MRVVVRRRSRGRVGGRAFSSSFLSASLYFLLCRPVRLIVELYIKRNGDAKSLVSRSAPIRLVDVCCKSLLASYFITPDRREAMMGVARSRGGGVGSTSKRKIATGILGELDVG